MRTQARRRKPTQQQIARVCGITTRQVRRLVSRGLPIHDLEKARAWYQLWGELAEMKCTPPGRASLARLRAGIEAANEAYEDAAEEYGW